MQDPTLPPSSAHQMPLPPPPHYKKRKSRWWIPVVIILGIIAVFFIAVIAFVSSIFSSVGSSGDDVVAIEGNTVLVLDLSTSLAEHPKKEPFSFGKNAKPTSLFATLTALKAASTDQNIKGILLKGAGTSAGMAKLTEVRQALLAFKNSKKFVYAHMESGTKADYYLASVADSIFMPEEGMMVLNAFGTNAAFMKGLFDKLGVSWHVEQFEEYKSAAESMSRTNWSDSAKSELRAIILQRKTMWETAIAASRKMEVATVAAALDSGMFTPQQLKEKGFIDGYARDWELNKRIHRRLNPTDTTEEPKLNTVSVSRYIQQLSHQESEPEKTIAIVYASGAIAGGKKSSPFDDQGIYSKTLIKDLRKAGNNTSVDAILLRIDSPGGSAFASDEIWAVVQEIRKKKPVYASMSDVAASGGYYIAMACDTIVCHPATITGSIGVIMAIPNVSGTMNNIGVTSDTIAMGKSANFMSGIAPLSSHEKATLHNLGENIYKRFVSKAADSRKKDYEALRAVAKGRVWTGQDAKRVGLVDIEGGLMDAINALKVRIGLKATDMVNIERYPEEQSDVQELLSMFGLGNDDENEATATAPIVQHMLYPKSTPAEFQQLWNALPVSTQTSLRHTATMATIARKERLLVMMPEVLAFE
jgi:protease IV